MASLKYLNNIKNGHNKIKHIQYKKLRFQPYILIQNLTDNDVNILFSLRSRMIQVKRNFKNNFKQNLQCSFGCKVEENQQHQLECKTILDILGDEKFMLAECEYSDIFGKLEDQEKIIKIFVKNTSN